ncbi:MAG TPA: hypothetical protein DEB24_00500 [Coriobacteriia bacterium]|nr:hypothetical protein [Coriobacteriia bacterium]
MTRRALILFTRLPIAGQTKTRMTPALSPESCAELQWSLLADLSATLGGTGDITGESGTAVSYDLFTCYTPDGYPAKLERLHAMFEAAGFFAQVEGDLGTRMRSAFAQVFDAGYDHCLLLGSDIPSITAADIDEAWSELESSEVVMGPCDDGGFWLVGLKTPFDELFADGRYGTDDVMERARNICETEARSLALIVQKADLDTVDDLRRLKPTITKEHSPHLYGFLNEGEGVASL